MENIDEISTLKLSKWINSIRKILIMKGFFEHHLYSTIKYKIENTEAFRIESGKYLRFNPEPEIWNVGEEYDKFFWIGSLFRNENELTSIHKKEFTVADIYLTEINRNDMVSFFFDILEQLERQLNLKNLSKLPRKVVKFENFEKGKLNKQGKYWLIVTDYPIEESFYDKLSTDSKKNTTKFEIFFISDGNAVELAVGGNLGKNLNKKKIIKDEERFVNKKTLDKSFIGFGFGIERLIYIYDKS